MAGPCRYALTVPALLIANADVPDDERVTIRHAYTVGLLARSAFADVVAYGRSLGVDIEVFKGGGWLEQRGRIVASGEWGKVRRFLAAYDRLAM